MNTPFLRVADLAGGYTKDAQVISEITLSVRAGEMVALLGANGSGKSTVLRGISGLLPWRQGLVEVGGESVSDLRTSARVRKGVCLMPQGHQLFGGLTVRENLVMGAYTRRRSNQVDVSLKRVTEQFAPLQGLLDRRAEYLSGGERALVSLGRALMSEPKVLLLDEPSQGLSPQARIRVFDTIREVADGSSGAVLLAEQDVQTAQHYADRCYVLRGGCIVAQGTPTQVAEYTGVSLDGRPEG